MNTIAVHADITREKRDKLLARLPAKARKKVRAWLADDDDDFAMRAVDSQRLIDLQSAKGRAAAEVQELTKAAAEGKLFSERAVTDEQKGVPPGALVTVRERDTSALESAKAALASVQDQIDRLNERRAQRSTNPVGHLLEYVARIPAHIALAEHEATPAKRAASESHEAAVARTRAAIRDLQIEAEATKIAPIPAAEAKKRARQEIETLAASGRPETLALFERAGKLRWPTIPLKGVQLTEGNVPQLPDSLALIAFLFRDQLIAAVESVIDADGDDEGALTDTARKDRIKQIAIQILALEREEESLIEQAEREGFKIIRRGNADPRAVLNLSSLLPAPGKHK